MAGIGVKFGMSAQTAKAGFFDRAKVQQALTKAEQHVLGSFGAYVRDVARNSIRDVKKPSAPGSPPRNRTGQLKDRILFTFDGQKVVIGPVRLNSRRMQFGKPVPQVLEEGGDVETNVKWVWKSQFNTVPWERARAKAKREGPSRTRKGKLIKFYLLPAAKGDQRTARIEPRPYMAPAYQKGLVKLPKFWREARTLFK